MVEPTNCAAYEGLIFENDSSVTAGGEIRTALAGSPRKARGRVQSNVEALFDIDAGASRVDLAALLTAVIAYQRGTIVRALEVVAPPRVNAYRDMVRKRPAIDDTDMLFDEV